MSNKINKKEDKINKIRSIIDKNQNKQEGYKIELIK